MVAGASLVLWRRSNTRRPLTADDDLLRAAPIEMDDLPAARNSSKRRSSSSVQTFFNFRSITTPILSKAEMLDGIDGSGHQEPTGSAAVLKKGQWQSGSTSADDRLRSDPGPFFIARNESRASALNSLFVVWSCFDA